jgi:EAL domain-containing protein (putative c-di-GMP-specific phosphodiesterase class I)
VVRTIIAMSHGLNIRVVAEGVETDEQMRFLVRRKCDEAQGNFISRPVAAKDFCTAVRACANNSVMRSASGRWLIAEHQLA